MDLSDVTKYSQYMERFLRDTSMYIGKELARSEIKELIIEFILSQFERLYAIHYIYLTQNFYTLTIMKKTDKFIIREISSTIYAMESPFLDAYF